MDNITLVTNALEYYDINNETYENVLKNVTYIKIRESSNDIDRNVLILYDGNKKKIIQSSYEIIGVYNSGTNTWTWAWAIPIFKKNSTNIVRKLWNYGTSLDPSVKYLKTELITSRFRVADKIQLDIHVGIAGYLSKNPLIYKYVTSLDTSIDSDGYINVKNTKSTDYTIYYMFLLDYKNIQNMNESVESE